MNLPPVAFRSPARHGYGVEFSPYLSQRIGIATSQNYGIAGGGSLFIVDVTPSGASLCSRFEWTNGLFDLTWSENNENIIVVVSGDGSVLIWNIKQPGQPPQVLKEHTREVYGVDWSTTRDQHLVLSASWDKSVKLWDPQRPQSVATYAAHHGIVYNAIWSPYVPGCFVSASGDGFLRVWDIRHPPGPRINIHATNTEAISCDWCKYDKNILAAGTVDGAVIGWDLRNFKNPLFTLQENGHTHAIRKIKFSPHHRSVLASCSYDFTTKFWDFAAQPTPLETVQYHTEFVCGLDFNLHIPGQVADCSWDEKTIIYTPKSLQAPR